MEIFNNEEHRRNFLEEIDKNMFLKLINKVNGFLRGKDEKEWTMDGDNVGTGGNIFTGLEYISPRQEDKVELLANLLKTAKKMNREERNLEDIALLLSSTLNAIHPYLDGNGRLSRLIYKLVAEGYDTNKKQNFIELLSDCGKDIININPGLISFEIQRITIEEIGNRDPIKNPKNITNLFCTNDNFDFIKDVDEEDAKLFMSLKKIDSENLFLSIFLFVSKQKDVDAQKYVKQFTNRSAILVDEMSKHVNGDELKEILNNYRNIKNKYIYTLMDAIDHPDKAKYQIKDHETIKTLKEYFEEKIK